MITYWLYLGERLLTSVRAPEGLDDASVRCRALASHQRVPLCMPEFAPFEFSTLILSSEVRIYERV